MQLIDPKPAAPVDPITLSPGDAFMPKSAA
jgi:hypothetical protein